MIQTNKLSFKAFKTAIFSCLFTMVVKFASLLKVSFIIGSYAALFSATSIMIPLSGAFGGVAGCVGVSLMLFLLKVFSGKLLLFKFLLAYHVPGLCAALYFRVTSSLLRLFLPALCMVAFIAHPVGGSAWAYTLYWFIPMALYFVPKKSFFLDALASTFIAHAVGSALFIYAEPMTAAVWLGLIPIVAIERLVFASGMTLVYAAVTYGVRKSALWQKNFAGRFIAKLGQLS
jgi:hypothetical protein